MLKIQTHAQCSPGIRKTTQKDAVQRLRLNQRSASIGGVDCE
jgi:hypothetical protein